MTDDFIKPALTGRSLTVDECRGIQVKILNDIDRICSLHGIGYCLGYGTLLGAIRHKGFIPWDDDIDLLMPRPDYMKFLEVAPQALLSHFQARNWRDDVRAGVIFTKVCDVRTVQIDGLLTTAVAVDVFPVDGLPDQKILSNLQFLRVKTYDFLLWTANGKQATTKIRQLIRVLLTPIVRKFGVMGIMRSMERSAMRFHFNSAKFVGSQLILTYGRRERIKRSDLLPFSKGTFQGREYPIPHRPDKYLSALFGDYMKLPPEDQRKLPHPAETYWLEPLSSESESLNFTLGEGSGAEQSQDSNA